MYLPTHHPRLVLATVIMMTWAGFLPIAGRGAVANCCLGERSCCGVCEGVEPDRPMAGCCASKVAQPVVSKTKHRKLTAHLPSQPEHVCQCAWNAPRVPSPANRPHVERQDELRTAPRQEAVAVEQFPRLSVRRAAIDEPKAVPTPGDRQALLCRWLT